MEEGFHESYLSVMFGSFFSFATTLSTVFVILAWTRPLTSAVFPLASGALGASPAVSSTFLFASATSPFTFCTSPLSSPLTLVSSASTAGTSVAGSPMVTLKGWSVKWLHW